MTKSKTEQLLSQLEGSYNIKKASDLKPDAKIRTGVFALDMILSGGLTDCLGGHRLEFFGAESSCKTTFALQIIKRFQALGKTCAFIDGENSYDTEWAEILGVDNKNLLVIQPKSLEEAGDLYIKLIPEVDLIVTDSIVSMIPEEEIERDTGEPTMALQARVNALITRKIYQAIGNKKTIMIFINQLREKVGVMYGSPNTTGGGHALKHLYNTRIEFRAGQPIEQGTGDSKERIGMEIHMKAVKNKKGVPYKTAVCDFFYTGSIDNKKSIFFCAIKHSIIELSGKTYTYGKTKVVGKENMIEALVDEQWAEIEDKLWKVIK